MMIRVPVLAQGESLGPVFFWLLVLMALLVVAAGGVLWLRRWYRTDESPVAGGFTLGDLRRLHREGQMSDEEFERAKAQIIAGARRAIERDLADAADGASDEGNVNIESKPDK